MTVNYSYGFILLNTPQAVNGSTDYLVSAYNVYVDRIVVCDRIMIKRV